MASSNPHSSTIAELRNNTTIWYKLHVLIYDLRNFSEVETSQLRLDSIADASYLSLPYFTPDEATIIKSSLVDTSKPTHPGAKKVKIQDEQQNLKALETVIEETLKERLERRNKKREESGDFRVCAAHDLAPILEKALDIKPKNLANDKAFVELIEKYGLELGDGAVWKGVQKKGGVQGGKRKKGKH
ncbi:uncharacterized protein RSE6_11295 [Rhynchosporium secalis]|uniref:Uncharacterized protein n=1 Tax=Rhynchosporium secalis TaxID=38038 RepID=A0A1E1MMM5_RHYSE|nr:uncharacterized protein RSE6_11295 [Rhynchosporium secalis]